MKYYALICGEEKKIFIDWPSCQAYMKGKKGISYKSFSSEQDAKAFLFGEKINIQYKRPTAYIDGSYNEKTQEYSFGAVLLIHNQELTFQKKYEPDEFSSSRNVAGEIKGAGFIIQYAIHHQLKELDLYYDYEGIEKWYTGAWKANSLIAKKYVEFREKVKDEIIVYFHKVKSHTNNKYNDMVDALAKEALGLK